MESKKLSLKKFFHKENLAALRYLPQALGIWEKIIIILMSIAIVTSIFFIWLNHWFSTTREVPASGGVYVEGIVAEAKELDRHISRLVGIGLTKIEENGDVTGDAAEKWEILDNGKTYKFTLRENFNAYDFAGIIEEKKVWPNTTVETPADNILEVKFKQPLSPFLYISTEPIFPYGPYKIIKEEKDKITLQSKSDYWRGQANIDKIVIKLYKNQQALIKAAKSGEVMGYLKEEDNWQSDNFNFYQMSLPRHLILFFNLSKTDLQNVNYRRNLRDGKKLNEEHNWILVTSDSPKNVKIANDIKNRWKDLKVNLEIKTYSNVTLQRDIIPKREYDLLLYGLDYGPDPDPYPFWHSSQIKIDGMNLSNFSNTRANQLLESARQTYDFKLREEKYAEFRKILDSEVPYISIDEEKCLYEVSQKIKGINKIFGTSEADRFLNVSDWYIKVKRIKK